MDKIEKISLECKPDPTLYPAPIMQPISQLAHVFVRPGRLDWIGIRPQKRGPIMILDTVELSPEIGLVGDHYAGRTDGPTAASRQLTLIQAEHLPVVAALTGRADTGIDPALLRRNFVISGINLLALKDQYLRIGDDPDRSPIVQITGQCHPCSKMETALGPGGYNAMRGHGGLTARIVRGGTAWVGAEVFIMKNE
jgi:MOSC domain-containing protein YiiM